MLAVAIALLAGCAGSPSALMISRRAVPRLGGATSPMYVLTRQDLARRHQGESLYESLAALRPFFLHPRGATPSVALDGVLTGASARLRDVPVAWVERVELLNASEATFRYGLRQNGAVVAVTTRRAP